MPMDKPKATAFGDQHGSVSRDTVLKKKRQWPEIRQQPPRNDGAKSDTLGSSLRKAKGLNWRRAEDKPNRAGADRSFLSFCASPPPWSDHLPDGLADEDGPGEPWALLWYEEPRSLHDHVTLPLRKNAFSKLSIAQNVLRSDERAPHVDAETTTETLRLSLDNMTFGALGRIHIASTP